MNTSFKRLPAGVALALAASLAAVATTSAAPPASVTGGKVVLKLDPATAEGFADMSIGIETTGVGKDGKRGFSWPISDGAGGLSPGPRGSVLSYGGLAFFTEGGPGTKFSKFGTRFGTNKTQLYAKSEGGGGRFLNLDLSEATVSQGASGLKVKDAPATLTRAGAAVLSDTFDFPFHKGLSMGTVTIRATVSG
ncbi:MAG: hypothetical protein QOI10_1241 [Solirubrobacterales bacterium]|jgi:hypothetical protein|nr:hypothetical protein [Solirubrobacterales bacterium]